MTLTDFLLARIAEDEAAVECIETVTYRDRWFKHPTGEVNHISPHGLVLHGRRRLLAECEAKRRIVGAVAHDYRWSDGNPLGEQAKMVLELMARPYADHPDYREQWKP